jgi:aryl-alcohol dehydrogenase-like predicted oxidoreductase
VNCSLSDLATKFVLSFSDVSSVLVGIDKMEFLNKAVALASGEYLADDMIAKLKQLAYPDPEFLNLAMWDRQGWLK